MRSPAFWWENPGIASALLSPVSAIYGSIAARRLAQRGARAGVPVICVGNPTVGGAGKTPTAMAIARMLIAAGERPMFLTRGYGGRLAGPVVVEPGHSAIQVGDEPLLLTRVAPTVVAHNRAAGAELARDRGASVIVMDDGFQNPALTKDFSILVIDGTRRFGNGCVIPAGPLRAPLALQLARADAILVVGESTGPLPSTARVFHGVLAPDAAAVKSLAGCRVLAFAGIGDPGKFFATLAAAGIEAPVRRCFPDHHRYSRKEAAELIADAKRANLMLLTTEKDLARMAGDVDAAVLGERARALPVNLQMIEADEFRATILGRIRPA